MKPVATLARRVTSSRLRRAFAALALTAAIGPVVAHADVAESFPADALVVVKVNKLDQTNQKMGKFFTDLGVTAFQPMLENPVDAFLAQIGATNGVDRAGELGFAFLDPAKVGGDEDNAFLVLVPVSDYDAFVGNFQEPVKDGAVTQVKMPQGAKPGFVAKWGDYAALSPAKNAVATQPGDKLQLPARAKKEMADGDFVLYANTKALEPRLAPQLAELRTTAIDEVKGELTDDPEKAKFAPVAEAGLGKLYDAAGAFLRDADSATVAVTFGEDAVSFNTVAAFKAGSYLAGFSKALGTADADGSLLAGLPDGRYLFAGGVNVGEEAVTALFKDVVDPVLAVARDDSLTPLKAYAASVRQYVQTADKQAFGMVTPTGASVGTDALIRFGSVTEGDSAKLAQLTQEMQAQQEAAMAALGGAAAKQPKSTVTPNAKTVAGVAFTEISVVVPEGEAANDPEVAQMKQGMDLMYGKGGAKIYVGPADADTTITYSGLTDEQVAALIAAAKAGDTPVADNAAVKPVADLLQDEPVAAFYYFPDQIALTLGTVAGQMGLPIELPPFPDDVQPIGTAVSVADDTTIEARTVVPSSTLSTLIAAGMQVFMQMQGGRGGAGGL